MAKNSRPNFSSDPRTVAVKEKPVVLMSGDEERREELLSYLRGNNWRCRDCRGRMLLVDGFSVCENGCGRLLHITADDQDRLLALGRGLTVSKIRANGG